MKKIFLGALCLLLCLGVSAKAPVKIACVGNSITYGYTIENRERDSYPAQLQRMLGEGYSVTGMERYNKPLRPLQDTPMYS